MSGQDKALTHAAPGKDRDLRAEEDRAIYRFGLCLSRGHVMEDALRGEECEKCAVEDVMGE